MKSKSVLIKNYFITNHTCPYSGTIVTRVIKCILNTSFNPHAFVSFEMVRRSWQLSSLYVPQLRDDAGRVQHGEKWKRK